MLILERVERLSGNLTLYFLLMLPSKFLFSFSCYSDETFSFSCNDLETDVLVASFTEVKS